MLCISKTLVCSKYVIVFLFYTIISSTLFSQKDLGTWTILNIKQDLNKDWNIFAEAQLRSISFYNNFHYYEYKAGVQYKINEHTNVAIGLGSFDTYQINGNFKTPMNNDETRTWVQFGLQNKIRKLAIDHRYRAEQRFTSNGFKNRFRYRVNIQQPFVIAKKQFAAFASNELFFTNNAPYFERNRFSFGLQKKWKIHFSMQLAYLQQFDYRINDELGRNFFQISLLCHNLLKLKKPSIKENNTIQRVDE